MVVIFAPRRPIYLRSLFLISYIHRRLLRTQTRYLCLADDTEGVITITPKVGMRYNRMAIGSMGSVVPSHMQPRPNVGSHPDKLCTYRTSTAVKASIS